MIGYSQDSFYRFKELYDEHGEAGLQEISRKKPILKNRIDPTIEEAVKAMATEQLAYGCQLRVSNEFNRAIQKEFYQVAFRKKIYHSIEELQEDRDQWLWQYNHERTQTGKYCFGRTPYQTFQVTKYLAKEKMLDTLFLRQEMNRS